MNLSSLFAVLEANGMIRSCYYHLGRTTSKSIFFISDAIPITDKYILSEHLASNDTPYIIKNSVLLKVSIINLTGYLILKQQITTISDNI